MERQHKLHTLTITEHDPNTRFFRYKFSCPGYEENEHAPCEMSTPCDECSHIPTEESDLDTFIKYGKEHYIIDGEWSVPLECVCAVRDYPDSANDSDVDEIAQEHGNGTYLVDVVVDPYFEPATWDVIYKGRVV